MRLPVRAPFHLEATVRLLQRRPANLIDRWEEQRYRRAIQLRSGPVLIEVENRGTIDAPEVRLSALAALLELHSRRSLASIVERFGDYRGYLCFYGLASRLLAAGLIHPAIA